MLYIKMSLKGINAYLLKDQRESNHNAYMHGSFDWATTEH